MTKIVKIVGEHDYVGAAGVDVNKEWNRHHYFPGRAVSQYRCLRNVTGRREEDALKISLEVCSEVRRFEN